MTTSDTTTSPAGFKTLKRGINYLGALGAKLRDLQGFATLAFELIQNADDARGATRIRFRVLEEGVVVENDARFSDCGMAEEPECEWPTTPGSIPQKHSPTPPHSARMVFQSIADGPCSFRSLNSSSAGRQAPSPGVPRAFLLPWHTRYALNS